MSRTLSKVLDTLFFPAFSTFDILLLRSGDGDEKKRFAAFKIFSHFF